METRPITLAAILGVTASVGFIAGHLYQSSDLEKQRFMREGISQLSDADELMDRFSSVLQTHWILEDLESIDDVSDLSAVVEKYQSVGRSQVEMFNLQLNKLKSSGGNADALAELEKGVREVEASFRDKE